MDVLTEEEISPFFPSCSSSSSSATTTTPHTYEVFLSFRGEDTRTNFTDHLHAALKKKGINVYRDEEKLKKGKRVSELFKAIDESRFAVIVFSKNYADSKWCLDELANIVECREKGRMEVLPVFYHVDPRDVRNQTGTFAFAEEISRKRKKGSMEKEQSWRAALKEVGKLNGWHLQGDRNESEVVHEIVDKIFKKLHRTFPGVMKDLVGIKRQLVNLRRLLCVESDDVRVIGILGMGGIGKTTLAKVVCNKFSTNFESCIFINEISKERDLVRPQEQLLCESLKEKCIRMWNVEKGVDMIKSRLNCKKILLVLDDVNHLDQLKYLAGKRDWFGSGSRIIITTRDQHLLKAYRVDEIHECKELNYSDSLKLLCLKAFEKEQPEEGYEEISQRFVEYANGLPLALDVLGSLLVGETINEWKDILKRVKEYPENDIIDKLKISYDRLNFDEKRIFLYIACFLKGRNRDLVIDILDSFDLHPKNRIKFLIKRSLITISQDNIVCVHDHLQDMAWEILHNESPEKPGNRRGLKRRKDILDVLKKNKGSEAIEIICLQSSMEEEVASCSCNNPKAFSKMTNLKFLGISNVDFPQGIENLSDELRILDWYKYPLKSLPSSFQSDEILELDMRCSQIEYLWEGVVHFPNLRSIDLSFSENLIKTPDLTETPRLEELDLHGCKNLVEGHPSILVHKRLNYLNLAGCISLEIPPSNIKMDSLKTLILSDCSKVKSIPKFGKNMKCLEELHVDGTDIGEIPPSIKCLEGLKHLNVSRCSKLGKRYSSIAPMISLPPQLYCLESLNLSWCNLFKIPDAIGCLSSLIYLNLEGNNFDTLPASISQLKLFELDLNHCEWLQSAPKLPSVSENDYLFPIYSGPPHIIVDDCPLLETLQQFLEISELGERRKCLYYLRHHNCPKLIENENTVAIVKNHLQEYGWNDPFFTTTFGLIVPQWFTHQVGNYVSVQLPRNWCDSTWLGFALCASFSTSPLVGDGFAETKVSIFATTLLPDLQCIYHPVELILKRAVKTQAVWYVPKDTNAFEPFEYINCNQCNGHITFYFETEINAFMECGVRLVCKEDVEELIQTTSQASGSNIPPSCLKCPKLIENENYISLALLKRHLQEYGCKVQLLKNIVIQGDEIPQWFTHQNVGNSVSVKLPPNWCDSRWLGFAFCAHFNILPCFLASTQRYIEIYVMSLPDVIQGFLRDDGYIHLYDKVFNQAVWYVPKDKVCDCKHNNLMDWNQFIGNITFLSRVVGCGGEHIMKCGVRLVYKQDVEELIQTTSQASISSIPPSVTRTTTS